jgi:hypothetical protein
MEKFLKKIKNKYEITNFSKFITAKLQKLEDSNFQEIFKNSKHFVNIFSYTFVVLI